MRRCARRRCARAKSCPRSRGSERHTRSAPSETALALCIGLCEIRGPSDGKRSLPMTNSRVTGVRSVELGVRDLHQSAEFYTKVWALEEVCAEVDCMYFRATGGEHHVLTIRERPKPALVGVHFAANDRAAVDAICAKAKSYGVDIEREPAPLDRGAGGGYGFRFRTPDGLPMSISSDLVQHPSAVLDRSRPTKISHVVINIARTDHKAQCLIALLGFKLSDTTHMIDFFPCRSYQHIVAYSRNNCPSLNHVSCV